MSRTILHCDCNNFFASVEELLDPSLKEIPMAVGGDEKSRRGIILAKNENAKKYGIKTAETIWQAQKKCPNLKVVPPHFKEYSLISKKINKIYESYTDLVEPFSIDESYLDVTGSQKLFDTGKEIADELRKRIKDEIGITISVGVSFNKVFAKLGSDYKKPDATTVITEENYKDILFPLPADSLMFVGHASFEALKKMGIHTIGDIAACPEKILEKALGKSGLMLHKYANGLDDDPVKSIYEKHESKSIGNSITFSRDISSKEDILTAVYAISQMVSRRMRQEGVKGSTIQIGIKYSDFKYISRQKTLLNATNISKEIADNAFELIWENLNKNKSVRLLSIQLSSLTDEKNSPHQISLLGDEKTYEKQEKLDAALDKIRLRFGKDAVTTGGIMTNTMGIKGHHKGE